MTQPTILIACIGNIFLGDDGFGCEVAKRLAQRSWPDNVKLVDFGIRGFDLAYALLDGYDVTIFVDATPRGGEPGTLYTIEPDVNEIESIDAQAAVVETHGMNPMKVLSMVKSMGGQFRKILLVGCEPATFGPEEGQMGLSEPVEAAVDGAARIVESLVLKMTADTPAEVVYE
ncbi:MAG TPA: hydrogenase maturation protease [Pyrinomonadaceae bacterium]|nr:hydrogenase maturation protease [Pyrinomonadaceae bacterium]